MPDTGESEGKHDDDEGEDQDPRGDRAREQAEAEGVEGGTEMFDCMMKEYLLDHGAQVRGDGVIEIPKRIERRLNIGKSVRRPGVRTLVIPSVHGLTLLYEGQHWVIK